MKKILIAILAVVYLVVSTGVAINVHYCMGKISSADIFSHEKCSKCGMKMGHGGCCKDEFKLVKLSDTHKLVTAENNFKTPVTEIDNNYSPQNFTVAFAQAKQVLNNNSPPQSPSVSLNILFCVFRI